MTDTYLALLATVRAHPDDDTPRLVLADHVEEQGRPAWATLIRDQYELSRAITTKSLTVTGQAPLRERIASHIEDRDCLDQMPGVKELHPFAYSWAGEPDEQEVTIFEGEQPDPLFRVRVRRGFVTAVYGELAAIRQHLPALRWFQPVEVVIPTDVEAVEVH